MRSERRRASRATACSSLPAHARAAGLHVRGTAGFAAAAPAGRGPLRAQQRRRARGLDAHRSGCTWSSCQGDRTFKPVSASAGLLYDLPPASCCAADGAVHRSARRMRPSCSPRALHEATGTFEIGNPFLGIEKARTFELGLRRAQGGFRFDASVYHTKFDGFIFKRLTGATCGETFDTAKARRRCGRRSQGAELRAARRDFLRRGVDRPARCRAVWRGMCGVSRPIRFRARRVRRRRQCSAHSAASARRRRLLSRRQLAGEGQHAARVPPGPDRPRTRPRPSGYTLLNAELSYTQRLAGNTYVPEFTVGIKGDNLLNEDVRNHVSFKKDEVLLPGATCACSAASS